MSFTSSETTILPASVTALHVKLKSLRLIFPLISKPAFVCPYGSVATPLKSVSKVTSLGTSRMVKSPTSLLPSYDFDLNFNSGNDSALKNSSDFKCASRSAFLVLIESTVAHLWAH